MDKLSKRKTSNSVSQGHSETAANTAQSAGDGPEPRQQTAAYPRISLTDMDRPGEPLAVEVEESSQTILRVAVPNTFVKFELRRQDNASSFEGVLGGRHFMFDPPDLAKKKTPR
jgi:hypothetical protein